MCKFLHILFDGYIYIIPLIYRISLIDYRDDYYFSINDDGYFRYKKKSDAEETREYILQLIDEYWNTHLPPKSHNND